MGRCLLGSHVRFGHPRLEGPTLVLLQLFNESVLHLYTNKKGEIPIIITYLSEEGRVEFVPLRRLEICLLQYSCFAKDVDTSADIQIPACELLCVALVCTVQLFHVVLGVLDDDLVRLAIKSEYNDNIVFLAVFSPPGRELQALDLIYSRKMNKLWLQAKCNVPENGLI